MERGFLSNGCGVLKYRFKNSIFLLFIWMQMFKSKLWRKFQILGVFLSVAGFILIPISQIRMEIREGISYGGDQGFGHTISPISPSYVYPFNWLMLPAVIILTIGIVSIICGYLVKRNRC